MTYLHVGTGALDSSLNESNSIVNSTSIRSSEGTILMLHQFCMNKSQYIVITYLGTDAVDSGTTSSSLRSSKGIVLAMYRYSYL